MSVQRIIYKHTPVKYIYYTYFLKKEDDAIDCNQCLLVIFITDEVHPFGKGGEY